MEKNKNLFERILSLEQFVKYYNNFTIISGKSIEERNNMILDSTRHSSRIVVDYTMEATTPSTTNSSIQDIVSLSINNELPVIYNPFGFTEIEDFILLIKKYNRDIVIDITGLSIRLLGMILSGIKDAMQDNYDFFNKIFCAYTEAKEYRQNALSDMFGSILDINCEEHSSRSSKRFNLYSSFAPVYSIPRLESIGSSDDGNQTWIVLLGFEGERPGKIHEELSRVDNIISLITFPSIRLGLSNYTFEENSHFLAGISNKKPDIDYISAISPFSTYNYLCTFKNKNPNDRLLISPLGTKATSLGAILYAINNPECSLVFDNPYETADQRSKSCGKSYLFDITEALKYN
jgi:hypothetical protein